MVVVNGKTTPIALLLIGLLAACGEDLPGNEHGVKPGRYALTWECMDACHLWLRAAATWDHLDLEEDMAWFTDFATIDGREVAISRTHSELLVWREDGCVELADGIPNGQDYTDPLRLCLEEAEGRPPGSAVASVTYSGLSGDQRREWLLLAVPITPP